MIRRVSVAAAGWLGSDFCKRCLCSGFFFFSVVIWFKVRTFSSSRVIHLRASTLQIFWLFVGNITNDADAPASERDRWQEQSSVVVSVDSRWHESGLRRAVEHGLCAVYQAVVSGQVLWDALAFSVSHDHVSEATSLSSLTFVYAAARTSPGKSSTVSSTRLVWPRPSLSSLGCLSIWSWDMQRSSSVLASGHKHRWWRGICRSLSRLGVP